MNRLVLHELVLGLWKIHILHHAATEGVVGHHMLQELREHGYDVSPGTLYPLLHRMEKKGWLRVVSPEAAAHAARIYEITPAGNEVLGEVSGYVAELHDELASLRQPTEHSSDSARDGDNQRLPRMPWQEE